MRVSQYVGPVSTTRAISAAPPVSMRAWIEMTSFSVQSRNVTPDRDRRGRHGDDGSQDARGDGIVTRWW
jgi:VanZ family protein